MKANIDIKTPAGKSLEGFPTEFWFEDTLCSLNSAMSDTGIDGNIKNPTLHKGDTITIKVLE